MCGSEVEQGAMESGKWVFTAQFFLLFCVFVKFHDKIVDKKLYGRCKHLCIPCARNREEFS